MTTGVPPSLGSAQIGAQQIYDLALATSVKVDVLLTQHSELVKDNADHEQRIRALERRQWPLPTLAVLVAIASLALSALVALGLTGR